MPDAVTEMPTELKVDLAAALGAVDILTPISFSFADGPPIDAGAGAVAQHWSGLGGGAQPEPGSEELLVAAIQSSLYERCYTHRLGSTCVPLVTPPTEDMAFAQSLSQANASHEHWDPAWVIYQFGANGQVFVHKGDRQRIAMPGAFISDAAPGMAPQIGTSVSLRAPSGSFGVQQGYYFAFGETLDEIADQLSMVRFYFNCDADGAVPLLAALTSELNRFQVPFQAKAPVSPALYDRTDAIVLYVAVRFFAVTARIIALARERITVAPYVPLFTKQLWPGIGIAVEPGTGESFGSHRCRLAAEGIVDAWRDGKQDIPARLAAAAARFAAAGLDLAHPYLGAGWVDVLVHPANPRLP